jgi:GDPmannose 4,6-dehydratase
VAVLITGIAGQDGSYLAELLTREGEEVTGLIHPGQEIPPYLQQLHDASPLQFLPCDLADPHAFRLLLRELAPERVFHFAAVSNPAACEADPAGSRQVNIVSCEVLLDWQKRDQHGARVLLMSSAAVFGDPLEQPQREATPPNPSGEYGRQKQAVRDLAAAARDEGHFAACAIAFNHESERRPESFVFAKVCNSAARIALGQQTELRLGPLTPRRDWGFAPDYVQAMAWMLDVPQPLELVIASGEAHSIGELAELACATVGLDSARHVISDEPSAGAHVRGADVSQGDPTLAQRELGWEPRTRFAQLVPLLVHSALERFRNGSGT